MATIVTTDTLRSLAGFRAGNGCALSLYLDLDPSVVPTTPDLETKLNSALAEAESHGAADEDLQRIREWWDGFDRDGARGIAIFASSADGFFRALSLGESAGDAVRVGPTLHLAPLAGALDRDGDLVAVVSRERGHVYRFEGGRLEEVADESEEQPGRHDQGGWSQARYQRHIDHLVQQHLKNVGEQVDRQSRGSDARLVVVGPEEMRGDFEAALSAESRAAIVGWTSAQAHAGPDEVLEVVRPLLDEARPRADQEEIARFDELHGRGERSATGWSQVLAAASDARVEVLLVEEGAQARGWECPACGRASADGGSCPLDGSKLEERDDAVDLAFRQTLARGGRVVRLGSGALGDAKGIAALLRF